MLKIFDVSEVPARTALDGEPGVDLNVNQDIPYEFTMPGESEVYTVADKAPRL